MFTDLTIPSSTLYNSIEYVNQHGVSYLKTMLAPLIGCIPGFSSFFDNINNYNSSSVLTSYMNTDSHLQGIGMGSTIISDLYLGGGIVAVILFMTILGRLINILSIRNNLISRIIECSFFSSCIFMCRDSYFYPTRFILWSILIIYSYNIFCKSINK